MQTPWMNFWFVVSVILMVVGFGGLARNAYKPSCTANDTIIYVDDEINKNPLICPVQGQQLTVVRQPNYQTYIKCSCNK